MDSYLEQAAPGYSYTTSPYGDAAYSASGMRRTFSENTDHSNRSAGSNDTHWSTGEYASQTSPVSAFDYSAPGYVRPFGSESQDTDYFVGSIGSQYQGIDEPAASYTAAQASEYSPTPTSQYTSASASGYTHTAASTRLLDSREGDEAAAWQASTYAQLQLSQTADRTPKFTMICCEDVERMVGDLRRRDPAATDREAVQEVLQRYLSQYLSRHSRGTSKDQERLTTALQEAAIQLQLRIQGEEAIEICFYALAAVLAELRGENPQAQETAASSSAMVETAGGSQRFVCKVRDCKQGAFGRAADLERHHKIVHLPNDKKKKFFCDYRRCNRHDLPFYRQDHFRDHLREFHKEDLLRRGNKADEKWWSSRSTYAIFNGWWRCNRCLVTRVDIQSHGWVCPHCTMNCETERQRYRTLAQR